MKFRRCVLLLLARSQALGWVGLWLGLRGTAAAAPGDFFAIRIVDAATGRGVPLVELRAVNETAWWSDSNGFVAFDEPGLMGTEVFLHVRSPGYEYPADGMGYRGLKVTPVAGSSATIRLPRTNVAERLYRVTGAGVYRDSVLLARPVPTQRPVLNGQVLGQDTVVATPYQGKIYWFWGDTERASYPLGHFGTAGATSAWPGRGGLDPGLGVDLEYFTDAQGFSRPMVTHPDYGMRWVEGPVTVRDEQGRERLVTRLAVHRDLGSAQEWHLLVWDDARGAFESVRRWDLHDPHQSAHPFRARLDDREYVYLFPEYRVPARLPAMQELGNYEALTCVAGDGRWRGADTVVERDGTGRARFSWKAGADRLGSGRLKELVAQKKLGAEDDYPAKRDFVTGSPLGRGVESVAWNEFRKRWIGFFADRPGEVWFAEADTPLGPWGYGRRVATHGAYNFYNLAQHAFFDQEGGRIVYFEGTYTDAFSDAKARTPRYNYNQIMYRLNLAEERLQLPVAVYRLGGAAGPEELGLRAQVVGSDAARIQEVAFFALPPEARRGRTVPVFVVANGGAGELSLTAPTADAQPLFMALPAGTLARAAGFEGLWACRARSEGEAGEGLAFALELKRDGERVEATTPGGERVGTGTLRAGQLNLRLRVAEDFFACRATVEAGRLAGAWQKEGSTEKGTWSATWRDPTPPEWDSPAVVDLRRFRRSRTGELFYAAAHATPPEAEPVGPVLCRVWTAPQPRPPMDWRAQPLPIHGKTPP